MIQTIKNIVILIAFPALATVWLVNRIGEKYGKCQDWFIEPCIDFAENTFKIDLLEF